MHFLIPLTVIAFRADGDIQRRQAMIDTAVDCAVSMSIGFALVIWLARERLSLARILLLVSMAAPYVRVILR